MTMAYRVLRGAAVGAAFLSAAVTHGYAATSQAGDDGYTVQRSNVSGVPTCEISGPADAPLQLALSVSGAGEAFVSLVNPAWQLAPDSHGVVVLAIGSRTVTQDFKRVSAIRMTARLGNGDIDFLQAVFAATIRVTFPGNRSIDIAGPAPATSDLAKRCVMQLQAEMSLRGDPFAAANGAAAPSSGPAAASVVPSPPEVASSDPGGSDDYYVEPPARPGDTNSYCGIDGPSGPVRIDLIEAKDSGFKLWVVNKQAHFAAEHGPVSLRIGQAVFTRTFDRVNDTTLAVKLGPAEQADDAIAQLFEGRTIEITFPDGKTVSIAGPTHKVRDANWICLRSISMPAIGDIDPLTAQD